MKALHVDCSRQIGPMPQLYSCRNTSLRYAPTPDVLARATAELGRAKLLRVFVTLDEMWDFRDDSYHFNYRIGRDRYGDDPRIHPYDRRRSKESSVDYYDYLDACSAAADELLFCFRRYEHEARNGVVGMEQYRRVLETGLRHYRERCPNIRYVEVTNESECDHFGGLDNDDYYRFFRLATDIVNGINRDLPRDSHLKIGGPVCSSPRFQRVREFLERYAADGSPDKRLDFISFHDYHSGDRPNRVAEMRAQVDAWLREAGMPQNLPVFITETGTHEGRNEGGNLGQAAGLCLLLDAFRRQHDTLAFPWCLYHDPAIQEWSTQMVRKPDGTLHLTPGGCAMKMLSMHRGDELACQSALDEDGRGALALASRDEASIVVQAAHYAKSADQVVVTAEHVPTGRMRVRQYRVNGKHGNCLADTDARGDIELADDDVVETNGELTFRLAMEPHDLWLVRIDPA